MQEEKRATKKLESLKVLATTIRRKQTDVSDEFWRQLENSMFHSSAQTLGHKITTKRQELIRKIGGWSSKF